MPSIVPPERDYPATEEHIQSVACDRELVDAIVSRKFKAGVIYFRAPDGSTAQTMVVLMPYPLMRGTEYTREVVGDAIKAIHDIGADAAWPVRSR